jgi:hypothetical protein
LNFELNRQEKVKGYYSYGLPLQEPWPSRRRNDSAHLSLSAQQV